MNTLIAIERKLEKEIDAVAPNAVMQRYASSESGGRKTMGAHVQINIPVASYYPGARKRLAAILRRLYGPISRVTTQRAMTEFNGVLYRTVVLVEGGSR